MLPLPYKNFPHVMPPDILRYHAENAASIFSSAGTESLIAYLLPPLGQYYGITRFSLFWYDRVLQTGVSTPSSVAGPMGEIFMFTRPHESPMVQEGIGGQEPVIKNHVDFGQGLKNDALWQDFLRHHSFARLAIAEREDMVFYAIFHADEEDMFPPETVRQLKELLLPLSVGLLESDKLDQMLYRRWNVIKGSEASILDVCSGLTPAIIRGRRVAKTDLSVLIQGETGSGKEVFTDLIHRCSNRSIGPFIKVNCGAVPENLADSLLFGHEKGSFTGAMGRSVGYFEQANNGTLFLDEIGELSLELQVKLLRVLDRKTIRRLGGNVDVPVDFRLIAATNRDLKAMIRRGTFRKDLWYRLAQYPICIPPLREHKEDIFPLTRYFVERHAELLPKGHFADISANEHERLANHSWPGNIRELEFVVCRAMVESGASNIKHILHFPLEEDEPADMNEEASCSTLPQIAGPEATPLPDEPSSLEAVTERHIRRVMEHYKGNITAAAQALGIHPQTLYRKWRAIRAKADVQRLSA